MRVSPTVPPGTLRLVLIIVGVIAGCLLVTNGALLTFRPNLFLRFYNWQNPGDHVGRTGEWRKNVYKFEYKVLGITLMTFGVFALYILAKLLW